MEALRAKYGLPAVPPPPGELMEEEVVWRDRQEWLEGLGYRLRPRYRKDWVPSWGDNFDGGAEDSVSVMLPHLLDATVISTGREVMLKCIKKSTHPYEVGIARFFSAEPLTSHPRNHCCPLYDVLEPPEEPDVAILVTPLLRPFYDPPMETIGEAVDFFRQVIEGLHFMHQCHVAHRDCMDLNIMMDAHAMFPRGFHPIVPSATKDYQGSAKFHSRTARPPKYYLIDFGLSRKYDPEDGAPSELPIFGGDKSVPEHQNVTGPLNPFQTDIYYLGNAIRTRFLMKTRGVEFMQPLVDDMVQDDPSRRPTMDEVLSGFEALQRSIPWWRLRSRLVNLDMPDEYVWGIGGWISYYLRSAMRILFHRSPIPARQC